MTKNAAMSYVADGIRVNSVHPGFIDTPLTQAQVSDINASAIASTPMKRAGRPIEVANDVLFLASDESSYMTGAVLAMLAEALIPEEFVMRYKTAEIDGTIEGW